jgi:glycosyltransferase involved in cell wall biosynthesis
MRVLLANKFFRHGAGAETAYFATRQLLADAGHDVIDFAMSSSDDLPSPYAAYFARERRYDDQGQGAARRIIDASASIYSSAARKSIRDLVRATKPDVAHLHNIYHQLTLSVIDGLHAEGVPVVLTLHDYKVVCPSYTLFTEGRPCRRCVHGTPLNAVRYRCVKGSRAASALAAVETSVARARRTYRRLEAAVAPSRFLADLATTQIEPGRIHVVPNFLPGARAAAPPVPADGREAVILFVGRLDAVKGVDRLLRAFAGRDTDGLRLQVAGDGPLQRDVVAAAGASSNIDYLGRLTSGEVLQRMRNSVAVVVPSLWEENCPMVVLEARLAGSPVVASASGGFPELVTDGEDGLLIDPERPSDMIESLIALYKNTAARDRMARAGQARLVDHHSPEVHLERLLHIYGVATEARR